MGNLHKVFRPRVGFQEKRRTNSTVPRRRKKWDEAWWQQYWTLQLEKDVRLFLPYHPSSDLTHPNHSIADCTRQSRSFETNRRSIVEDGTIWTVQGESDREPADWTSWAGISHECKLTSEKFWCLVKMESQGRSTTKKSAIVVCISLLVGIHELYAPTAVSEEERSRRRLWYLTY
jgi:hypothetical protein